MTSQKSDFSLGKTPRAIENRLFNQKARDEWDLFMMDETIQSLYERWIALIGSKQEKNVKIRLFKEEMEDIEKTYPDVVQMFDSGKRGEVSIKKGSLDTKYDFVLEPGSTYQVDPEEEQNKITAVLKSVLESPQILESLQVEGKELRIGELFERWLKYNVRDWDNIIVDKEPESESLESIPDEMNQMPMPEQPMPEMPQGMPQGMPMPQEMPMDASIEDPQLQGLVDEVLGGMGGIPRV
jgi:hypothetical protein